MSAPPPSPRNGPPRGPEPGPPLELTGTIEVVTYHDEDSLYTVLRVAPEGDVELPGTASLFGSDRVTAVGKLPDPVEGQRLRLRGDWTQHRSHGLQFEFADHEPLPPIDRDGLVRYLSSKAFSGVGETLAKRIVEELGEKALEAIRDHPECLKRVRGLRSDVAEGLAEAVRQQFGAHQAQAFLRGLGLGPVQALATIRKLGAECEARLRADPYLLVSVSGLGFKTADRIARQLGIEEDDPRRLAAAALFALESSTDDGHSLLPRVALRARTAELLRFDPGDAGFGRQLDEALGELAADDGVIVRPWDELEGESGGARLASETPLEFGAGAIGAGAIGTGAIGSRVLETGSFETESTESGGAGAPADEATTRGSTGAEPSTGETAGSEGEFAGARDANEVDEDAARAHDRVYLPHLFHSERGFARRLRELLDSGGRRSLAGASALAAAERKVGFELHPQQREAVLALLATPVGLLTGGPGVGKTTIVRLLVMLAEDAGARVTLASPTGRAAKRLAEATGRDASTLHRLLGFRPGAGFERDDSRPLETDLLVVDEISMLDIVLANHLIKAVQAPTRVLFVGDPDQLPSVGPGNVLADMLSSGRVPVCRLTQIFRQEEGSLIVTNAHRILRGEMPVYPERGDTSGSFYFFPCEGPAATAERLVDVVTKRVPDTFGFDWTEDVQVLAPMYRGECGVDALNLALREAQGFGGRELVRGSRSWRVGDRVIQTRNDYEREVFNGDMGRVVSITAEGLLTVRFPERELVYEGGQLSDLMPAFAITVHRSQGGEFPVVVLPMVTQHAMMLQRNLFYTAVTRAKRLVVLVGSERAIRMAVENAQESHRESALAERLRAERP